MVPVDDFRRVPLPMMDELQHGDWPIAVAKDCQCAAGRSRIAAAVGFERAAAHLRRPAAWPSVSAIGALQRAPPDLVRAPCGPRNVPAVAGFRTSRCRPKGRATR